jgi:hypothetical protein
MIEIEVPSSDHSDTGMVIYIYARSWGVQYAFG